MMHRILTTAGIEVAPHYHQILVVHPLPLVYTCTRVLRGFAVFSFHDWAVVRLALLGGCSRPFRVPTSDGRGPGVHRGSVRSLRMFDNIHMGLYFQVRHIITKAHLNPLLTVRGDTFRPNIVRRKGYPSTESLPVAFEAPAKPALLALSLIHI